MSGGKTMSNSSSDLSVEIAAEVRRISELLGEEQLAALRALVELVEELSGSRATN